MAVRGMDACLRSLVNSVPGHLGLLKKDRSDQGPNWPRTKLDVIPVNLTVPDV